jgi:hypothetical protein
MRAFLALAAASTLLSAPPDPGEILRRSIQTADRSWKAKQNYTYTERDEERHLDSRGRVTSQDVSVSEAVAVDGSTVEQTVSHNGGPPTASENRKNQEILRKRKNETPRERADRLEKEKESRAFIDEVPMAFRFRLLGEEAVGGRPAYVLEATPNPGFHARSKYGRMFSRVRGKLWVDKEDFGWAKVEATITEPFSMGLFMARVEPGSHIVFRQTRVAEGIWLPVRIEIKAEAKILFVKNYVRDEVITYAGYRPLHSTQFASSGRPAVR